MEKTNIERLQVVAEGLQNLNDKVVMVDGQLLLLFNGACFSPTGQQVSVFR